jgi:hypothetical protein
MLFGGTLRACGGAGAAECHARAFASALQFNVAAIAAAAALLWWLGRRP